MARRRKKKRKLWLGSPRKKTKTQLKQRRQAVQTTFVVFLVLCICAAIGVGLIFLNRYVEQTSPLERAGGRIKLLSVPPWVSDELRSRILSAAVDGISEITLDADIAGEIFNNLQSLAWLDNVTVKTGSEAVEITAQYRRPAAFVSSRKKRYFLDEKLVVLDYVPITQLPIVEIKGLSRIDDLSGSLVGSIWQRDDAAAAMELLVLLGKMDAELTGAEIDKPLLYDVASIDVSNYDGRRDSHQPHILLYAKDDTEIRWGAEVGTWQRHLEATDSDKLSLLYATYEQKGTLQLRTSHQAAFIDLMSPQKQVPLPIDRY